MSYILTLVVVSALIAYMGDTLGTYVGKKRLTVFGLRPKVSALVITVITGIAITLFTLTVAAILSEDVKIALFSLDKLKSEISELSLETLSLTEERDNLEQEKQTLLQDVQRLNSIVRIKETESVVFRKDEPLAARVIQANLEPAEVMRQLTDLIIELIARVRSRGVNVLDEITFFEENRAQIRTMAEHMARSEQELVVGTIAGENINVGEHLGNVRFIVLPNNLIFRQNQEIASIQIDGRQNRGAIAGAFKSFMDEINEEVVNLGMIANPLTGKFGDLSSESMISFYDMVNRISALNREVILIAVVPEDTYAIGPLNVIFRFEEGEDYSIPEPAETAVSIATHTLE